MLSPSQQVCSIPHTTLDTGGSSVSFSGSVAVTQANDGLSAVRAATVDPVMDKSRQRSAPPLVMLPPPPPPAVSVVEILPPPPAFPSDGAPRPAPVQVHV